MFMIVFFPNEEYDDIFKNLENNNGFKLKYLG